MDFFLEQISDRQVKTIAEKKISEQRINNSEALYLFENASISELSIIASFLKKRISGDKVFFNKNFHIEPTNICIYNCKFCSYRRKPNEDGAWDYSIEEMLEQVRAYSKKNVSEVHIVGGVHPTRDVHYYGKLIKEIKKIIPNIHVKAFTAVELEYMIRIANLSVEEGLKVLKGYGLDSIPGGGAEIFDSEIRKELCDQKASTENWINIHRTAHKIGLKSNATILYGHMENYSHRIDHLEKLRDLQDETGGFNAFIPLKYRKQNNSMSSIGEVPLIEDLRNYAVSRVFLDNIPHLKAYWPMIGKQASQLSLSFGVDDLDGTIDDSTKIYSMAGVEDTNPSMSSDEIVALIKESKCIPVERDTLYNELKVF